jgi:hypothetical protein
LHDERADEHGDDERQHGDGFRVARLFRVARRFRIARGLARDG